MFPADLKGKPPCQVCVAKEVRKNKPKHRLVVEVGDLKCVKCGRPVCYLHVSQEPKVICYQCGGREWNFP